MKIATLSLLALIASLLFELPNSSKDIEFEFKSSVTYPYGKNKHLFYFCIANNTSDTLYISEQHIKLIVQKGSSILQQLKGKPGNFFPPPLSDEQFDRKYCPESKPLQQKKLSLNKKFAQLLYEKNFPLTRYKKMDRAFIEQVIAHNCIVLFPHTRTDYRQNFENNAYDKTYTVSAQLLENNIFCSFENERGNLVNITRKYFASKKTGPRSRMSIT